MRKNMGTADRITRLGLAIIIASSYFSNVITGTWALVLVIVMIVFILTSFFGTCPLYSLLGLSTREKKGPQKPELSN